MKKTYLAIIFSFLITFSCILSACNTHRTDSEFETPKQESEITENYSQQINDLKNQILELEQNNYISEVEREKEIQRLENLIKELKKSETNQNNNSNSSVDTSSPENGSNTEVAPEFLYIVEDEQAIITGFVGNDKNVRIPSAIDGYTVIGISDEAFTSSSIENITIPDTVTKIGWFAFKNCSNLKSITIPNSVKSIGYSAFTQTGADFSITCAPDSFAAKYAQSYGIDFKPI